MGLETTTNAITPVVSQVFTADSTTVTLTLSNDGADTVWLGTDNLVTDADGFMLQSGEQLRTNDYVGDWWAICSAGDSSTLRVDKETV